VMISTRSVGLLIDTVVCLTLAKWETVSGRFGGYLTIHYAEPKPSLWEIGVRPGTLLVDGRWFGDRFVGRARVFNLVCGAIPYEVAGGMVPGIGLVLEGPQWRVDWWCLR
jgi:hypothetical protein